MEEFVAYIIKNLVSVPESVFVSSFEDQDRIHIEIRVAQEDVGKVIGRRGNTINALRTIVRTVATRLGRKVQVELIQPDQVFSESCDPCCNDNEEESCNEEPCQDEAACQEEVCCRHEAKAEEEQEALT